jgi:dynein heavy chain
MANFDPYIFEVIKESEYMIKRELDIPEDTKVLVHASDKLRNHFEEMQVSDISNFQ